MCYRVALDARGKNYAGALIEKIVSKRFHVAMFRGGVSKNYVFAILCRLMILARFFLFFISAVMRNYFDGGVIKWSANVILDLFCCADKRGKLIGNLISDVGYKE